MYAINLDFDPTTVGFDPCEITKNEDNTYTVTRRFIHAEHYHDAGEYWSLEAYCPCLTDNVEIYCYQIVDYKGRMTYGVNYVTNDREKCSIQKRSFTNSMCDYMNPIGRGKFNSRYDTNIKDKEQEEAAAFCVSKVNGHPANITQSVVKEYFEKYRIVFGKAAPTSPEEDPFLPDEFKKMLGIEK